MFVQTLGRSKKYSCHAEDFIFFLFRRKGQTMQVVTLNIIVHHCYFSGVISCLQFLLFLCTFKLTSYGTQNSQRYDLQCA